MWEGVVLPAEERWEAGLRTLRDTAVEEEDRVARGGGEAMAITRRLRDAGAAGAAARGSAARADVFATALERCVECHEAAREW